MVTTTPGGSGQQAGGGSAQTLPPPKEVPSKIYLESYLETVTSLPAEVQRILCTLKDIDIRSQELEVESQTKTARCLEIPPQTSRNATGARKDLPAPPFLFPAPPRSPRLTPLAVPGSQHCLALAFSRARRGAKEGARRAAGGP